MSVRVKNFQALQDLHSQCFSQEHKLSHFGVELNLSTLHKESKGHLVFFKLSLLVQDYSFVLILLASTYVESSVDQQEHLFLVELENLAGLDFTF